MSLSIKNDEVERLIEAVVAITGETKTEAVRRALAEREERLELRAARQTRVDRFLRYLEEEIWPQVPAAELGRRLTKAQEEEILGIGRFGA